MIEVNEKDLASGVLTRQAIGRHGSIGNLYDIRDEKLLDENVVDGNHFFTEDCPSKNSFIDRHRSEKETWNKLNIEPSMQLSLRVSLLQEIPEYLQKTIFNSRTVRVTFVFFITTKRQYIQDNLPEQTLNSSHATHYISGITWGKRIFLTVEATSMNSKTAKELENELIAVLEKTTIQDDQIHFENLSNFETLKILLTDGISTEVFPKFDQDLIQLTFNQFIHRNDQQLQFELRPLKNVSNIDPSVYKTITNKIEVCFEEINKEKILINDYLDKIEWWKDWIPVEWRKMSIEINDKESQMKNQLRIILKKVRSGEMIEDFNVSSSPIKLQTEEIDFKIKILTEFDTRNLEIKQPNAIILLKTLSSLDSFISNYYDHQVYLLHISNQWIKRDPINWSKQLRCFMKLQETDEKLAVDKPIFRVVDHDLHTHLTDQDQPNSCTIYHAYRGQILSRDFFRTTSLKTLSLQQIRAIRMENKFTNLTDKDIESRHKQFIENHPTGEMNKEEFIQEFQQLYPKGNPRSYCHYAFDSIDTDHSGTIGFEEFMSAVALTMSGDIDKQLSLIFAVCDHDNSGKVSGAEIIKFLEVIAELENGKESIDYENIQTVAKKMMKACEKRNDQEEISKDEFIACLKNKYELCMAFLPVVTKKLSEDEINSIQSQHPTLTRDQILEWHKQFLNEHFEGELTRAGFIDEYKKLYPNGNPKPYCDYIFKVIDKDRSGTINFVEFTEAVALTQSNNADIRLKRIFTICDKDNSGTISRNEMAKTIEVIAALNHDLTLPWKDIQSIINQMLTSCGKDANDDLTELEFIHCCKNNEELGARFLPEKTNQRDESKSEEQSSKFWFEISNEKIQARTSAENVCINAFIEPMDFKNLSQLFMTGDETTRQSIVWAFASTLPCSTIVNREKIDFLYQGFEHETLGWSIAFVFRKFSEEREYLEIIPNSMWISILQLLDKTNLNEQIRTTIVYIMINIFKTKTSLSNEIKQKLQNLVNDNGNIPKKLLLATLNGLFIIVMSGSSALEENTLTKLRDLLTNEDNLIVERTHAILDYLDDKRTLSNSIRYSFNAQVKSELTATQNTSVSQSEEECIEPTAKFLGLDNLLGKTGHLDRSFTSNVEPTAVRTGDNQAWYRGTYAEIENLQAIAKTGNLKNQDFEYLLTKFKDDGWHFTDVPRETIYQMIAEAFRDSAKAQQKIPSDVTDRLIDLLYETANVLNQLRAYLDVIESLSNTIPTSLQEFIECVRKQWQIPYESEEVIRMFQGKQTKLVQTCSECILIIARDQQSLNKTQIDTIEKTFKTIKDTQVKKDLIEIYKLCVTKGHRANLDLNSLESELLSPSTSITVSYFFFQAAAVQNQVFSDHQMSLLSSVAKSVDHTTGARENCLWAMAYSIKMMSNQRSIASNIIDDLGEVVLCNIDTIQNAAVVALCYYVNESDRSLSQSVLERLAVILTKQDNGLANNVLSIYLKLAKQKHRVPPLALKNMSHFLQNNKEFELREKSIWILKYAVDNGENFELLVLNAIDHCLNDQEFSMRNTAANVFIQYWNRQILENELDSICSELESRMKNILLFFRNNFDRKIQKSALELIKNLVENNYKLSESLLDLIEYCLYDHDTSNATTAVMIIASYSKRNLLRKQTIACLEYLLTIDTVIQSNVVDILKTIVCRQEYVLSEKSINFLGQLLLKSIDPKNILILLKHADRYQPLPKAINNLVEQNYLIQVLRQSNCSASLDKAYKRLLTFTDDGIQLYNYVLNSIFSLLQSQMRLLNIIVNITSNGQHLNNEQIIILSKIDVKSNKLSLIRIFTNLTRQNHELPKTVIDSLEQFIDETSVQIYIIEIYQLLIERHELVDRSIVTKILNLLNSSDLTKRNTELNCRIASFFKAIAANRPDEVDQTYFLSLFQLQQSLSIRKDACLAMRSLAEHRIILNPQSLSSIIYLLNNDENIDIQNLLLQTLELAHSNHQITDQSVLQLLDLIHDQDIDNNEEFLKRFKNAIQSGLKLYDRHWTKLSHMLFSCDLNLKRDAATILALIAINGQIPSKKILSAVHATLLDETINQDTIQLLRKSPLDVPSSVIDDLLYLVLFSKQTAVKEIAQQILDYHKTDSRVMKFRLMLTMNKLTTILGDDDSLIKIINSKYDHKVCTGLQIVQSMIITQKRVPIDVLLSVTSRIASHGDIVLDILIVALEKGVQFDQSVCKAIEDAISDYLTTKTAKLLRLLAEKGFIFQTETLQILFDNLDDYDAFIALEYAAQHQTLPNEILLYFIFELSDELNDIEAVRRSFNIIRQQILKSYVQDPTELLENLRLPNGIDYERLSQIESIKQRLGTVLTLLSVDCIDLKVFDLPCEQWSRELLCTDLLAPCLDRTPMSIVSFYHQLTQLEQYKKYDLYNDSRDTILQELIRKKQTFGLTLSIINQILIYLQTTSDKSIDILQSNDSNWLINMRRFYIQDKLEKHVSNIQYSQLTIDHLINQLTQFDILSVELIEPFLRIINEPTQILSILEMLQTYQITTDELIQVFADDEHTTDQKSFLQQFELIILNKTLISKWSSPQEKLLLICKHFETMLNNGWTFTKIHHILIHIKFDDEEAFDSLNQFLESLNLLIDYRIDGSIEEKLSEIFSTVERKFWIEQVHNLVMDRRFDSISSEKNLEMLLNEIKNVNQRDFSEQMTQLIKQIDQAFNFDSSISSQGRPIKNWTKSNIKDWAQNFPQPGTEHNFVEVLSEMIAVLKRAIYLDSTYHPRLIQILSILIILDPQHANGRLLQILTGEGKSSIVSMLAVIKVLQGKRVDIVTSSITLAKRDAHERKNFYSMFDLTVAHNNDETTYIQGMKECYNAQIVYGTSSQFQFDILRHDFSLLNTRGNRSCDAVIIDEVDSMLIDENNTIARLADHLPGMEWLNSFLCGIWQCVNSAGENLYENKYTIIRKFITHLNDPHFEIQVPKHLQRFVQESIPLWIEHAIRAKIEYKLDHHYMIKADETSTKRIVPVDFSNTGVVQCSTTWSDGLHQFLQMKHGLKLTPLTVTTNFLSNTGYFTRYGNEIYGLTGTIGSNDAKDLLNKIYQVDTIIIPPFKQKRHFQLETILTLDDDEWLKSIVSTTVSHATNKQAVLIICETRLDAKAITKELQRVYRTGTIRLYADNTDAIEATVVSNQIQHGEIIVATNLAGRGTDLKTSQEVEKNGGLHVCLTFLPNNLRVEEQAIGRTSRQGHRGTSQMILSRNRTLLQLMSCYPDYLATCNEKTNYDSIELMRNWRETAERANIKRIWDNEIPEIRKKDDLFSNFCQLLNQLRLKTDDSYRLLSVKERWGLWLKSIDQINQNRQTLERMIEEPGFRCVDVRRDGNSFLNCIARHFSGQLTVENIKKRIIKHIHKNKDLYEKSDENNRYWAICRALNINIVILRSDYGPEIYKRKDAKSTCFLGYEVGLQYVALDTSKIDPKLEGSLLENIEPDAAEIQSAELNITDAFRQDKEVESLFLTKASSLDLKDNFKIFANEMKIQYETDNIFQNPCYLMLEANDIIEKLSSWSNWLQSYGEYALPIDKAKTADDAIKRLEKAIKLDSIFAFSASTNRAHFIVDKGKSDGNYKITAKSYLTQAKQQIEQFIMPQLYLMLIKPNSDNKEIQSKELFFDDFNKQVESKIDILQHYHNYINQAIQIIESSQKLIGVQSKHGQIINIGGKLYRQEVNDFIRRYPNTIDLTFHNLTVTEDMFVKKDQALQLLDTLTKEYRHISINYFDTKLETIEEILSKANLSNVCLTVQYLDKDQVKNIIVENHVTLTLIASTEQYKKAIKKFKGTVILDMASQRLYLSSDKALEHLNESNKIQSISFESLNQTTVNEIISELEKVAITLTFPELSEIRMNEICKTVKKPFLIKLQNLSRLTAENCINATSERNFTISLYELTVTDTSRILKSFDRNEQDVNSSLKSIANEYAKKDQANEELSAYRNMGIGQFISIQELNPRPWISICVTAGLGAAQIAAGVCLAAATCGLGVQLGIGLITEGISDIYYAVKGAISRNFSWKDYAIQKAISLSLCFVTLGCSAISQAAKAAQATSKGGVEFLKQTFKGAGALIKNSARTYATGAITGTAAKTGFKLAIKQVGVVCLETGARELANYTMDSVFPDLLSPLKSSIYDEIQSKTNVQREKEYYDRVLCRALIADICAGNDNWMQKLEETAVNILTKENSAFISIASSLASGITNAAVRHAKSFSGGGNSYVNWASRLLTVMPAMRGSSEIIMITDNFFAIFEKELIQLETQIPTFEYFIQQLDSSISQQTATEICQLLEKNTIINKNGTVNIQLTLREDTSIRNSYQKLVESLKNLKFPDEKHRDLTIKVLSKYQTMDPRSLKANKVQKRIVDMLTDQIIAIIHGTMVAPLANYVVGSAINALSEKIQLKLDSNGTVQDRLMQEGAQRYISNLSNDFVEDIKSGKIKIPPDMEEKLNAFLEKSKDPNFKPENPIEELAVAITNGKQGGVIEIAIIAAMTGKSINIVQSQQDDESNSKDADMTVKYTAPQVDKEGNIQDGHFESIDGNAESKGVDDCLYASTIGKTSNTFKDTQDMRMKCAAYVLANPSYIISIQPAINILSGCSNPVRRRQLMMEGGRVAMTTEERHRRQQQRKHRVASEEKWKNSIPDKIESARNETFMEKDVEEIEKNPNGLKKVPPVDDKDPTLKTYVRFLKNDANGNPVQRTEFVSAIFMPSDYRPNERENFPSSGNTSTSYMRNNLDGRLGDERGHLVLNALGGRPVAHNMAPQPASINRNVGQTQTNGTWYKNERAMISYIAKGCGFVRYEARAVYPDSTSGRPEAFKWQTNYYDKSGTLIKSTSGTAIVRN